VIFWPVHFTIISLTITRTARLINTFSQHQQQCAFGSSLSRSCILQNYPHDAMLTRVIAIATCLSVCTSVSPSATRRYCVKTKKTSVMISSPLVAPRF